MTTLKQLQEHKDKNKSESTGNPDNRSIKQGDDLIDLFPLPRYFQVHFEHIHDNTYDVQGKLKHLNHDLQSQLDQLGQTLAKVEDKLDGIIALLGKTVKPEY